MIETYIKNFRKGFFKTKDIINSIVNKDVDGMYFQKLENEYEQYLHEREEFYDFTDNERECIIERGTGLEKMVRI